MSQENLNLQGAKPDTRPDLLRAMDAVVLELADILIDYRAAFVVSGGLALHLLFPRQDSPRSVNIPDAIEESPEPFDRLTKDVDLVFNVLMLNEILDDIEPTISDLLMQYNYQQPARKRYWERVVNLPGFASPVTVPVEFLAPGRFAQSDVESSVIERVSAHQDIDLAPLGGIDLVLLQPQTVTLSGLTPGLLQLENVPVQVVDVAMLILVKAIAFQDRLRKHEHDPAGERHLLHAAKHAFDISECLRCYLGKMEALAERLAPLWLTQSAPEQPLIDDALECLRTHFASPTAEGIRRMVLEERYKFDSDNDKMVVQLQTSRRVQRLLALLDERMAAES